MAEIGKFRAVRVIVRPDRRDEYLRRFTEYAEAARTVGAVVRLLEDQVLPGRFLELTEHLAAGGMEGRLEDAASRSRLRGACVRREGDDVLYREVELEG